jgi:hypothetical protein
VSADRQLFGGLVDPLIRRAGSSVRVLDPAVGGSTITKFGDARSGADGVVPEKAGPL